MTDDRLSPSADIVYVFVAVHIVEVSVFGGVNYHWLSADGLEGAHGGTDPPGMSFWAWANSSCDRLVTKGIAIRFCEKFLLLKQS